jgi:hypothetical protein
VLRLVRHRHRRALRLQQAAAAAEGPISGALGRGTESRILNQELLTKSQFCEPQ